MTESDPKVIIRRATKRDLSALGRLGASLLLAHHAFDPRRFMAPPADPEAGYAWFLGTQLGQSDVAVFVAERAGAVIGYVYAAIEPQTASSIPAGSPCAAADPAVLQWQCGAAPGDGDQGGAASSGRHLAR